MSIWKWFGQSPSSIGKFDTCPRQFRESYLTKSTPYVSSPAQERGNRFHKSAEEALQHNVPMIDEFAHTQPIIDALAAWPGRKEFEVKYAVNDLYLPVPYNRRMLGNAIDLLTVQADGHARILDYKTGKPKASIDWWQLDCNALTVFANIDGIKTIRAAYWQTEATRPDMALLKKDYRAEDFVPEMKKVVDRKVLIMRRAFDVDHFPPKPSGLCKAWCEVYHCEHNGRNADGTEK